MAATSNNGSRVQRAEVIFNKVNLALAKSQQLLASLLPPLSEASGSNKIPDTNSEKGKEEEADLFFAEPELLGLGARAPNKDDPATNQHHLSKTLTANEKLRKQLLGRSHNRHGTAFSGSGTGQINGKPKSPSEFTRPGQVAPKYQEHGKHWSKKRPQEDKDDEDDDEPSRTTAVHASKKRRNEDFSKAKTRKSRSTKHDTDPAIDPATITANATKRSMNEIPQAVISTARTTNPSIVPNTSSPNLLNQNRTDSSQFPHHADDLDENNQEIENDPTPNLNLNLIRPVSEPASPPQPTAIETQDQKRLTQEQRKQKKRDKNRKKKQRQRRLTEKQKQKQEREGVGGVEGVGQETSKSTVAPVEEAQIVGT